MDAPRINRSGVTGASLIDPTADSAGVNVSGFGRLLPLGMPIAIPSPIKLFEECSHLEIEIHEDDVS